MFWNDNINQSLGKLWRKQARFRPTDSITWTEFIHKDKQNRKKPDEEAFVFVHFSMYDSAIRNKNDGV